MTADARGKRSLLLAASSFAVLAYVGGASAQEGTPVGEADVGSADEGGGSDSSQAGFGASGSPDAGAPPLRLLGSGRSE